LGIHQGIIKQPVAVTVDASNWNDYKSGVMSNCSQSLNHAALLVGVINQVWKIKNQWAFRGAKMVSSVLLQVTLVESAFVLASFHIADSCQFKSSLIIYRLIFTFLNLRIQSKDP
jgi:hypothetical protein